MPDLEKRPPVMPKQAPPMTEEMPPKMEEKQPAPPVPGSDTAAPAKKPLE
jgi:hypothetical protein